MTKGRALMARPKPFPRSGGLLDGILRHRFGLDIRGAGDFDPAGFQRLGHLAHEVDMQHPQFMRGPRHPHMIGQRKAPLKGAVCDAAMQIAAGAVVGGLAGGSLGAVIAPGDSTVLGAIIGGVGGAVIGKSIDRGNGRNGNGVRCR